MQSFSNFVSESSLSRVYSQYLKHETGTITAFRYARDCGEGKKYTRKENNGRNSILSAKLLKLGYGITSIQGSYIENYGSDNQHEVYEQSFFVVDLKDKGNLKRDLVKLGEKFDQDSITFSRQGPDGDYFLISSNTCENGDPGHGRIGVVKKLGKPVFSKKGEMFSKISGRPFVFENVSVHLHCFDDLSNRSKGAVSLIADEDIKTACEITMDEI